MVQIDYRTMQRIINGLAKTEIFDKFAENGVLIRFISKVWPIWTMKSSDKRFQNKADDINQHYVKNSDASWEHLFIEELKLLSSPDLYLPFLNSLTCFDLHTNEETFTSTVNVINEILGKCHLTYKKEEVFNPNEPYYKIYEGSNQEITPPPTMLLPIYFVGSGSDLDLKNCFFPCFSLEEDSWNDYGIKTLFRLSYWESINQKVYIGKVKILYRLSAEEGKIAQRTGERLPPRFFYLDQNFISLGQECSFYKNLINVFGL